MDRVVRVLRVVLVLLFMLWGAIFFSIRAERKKASDRTRVDKALVFMYKTPFVIERWLLHREHQKIETEMAEDIRPIGQVDGADSALYLLHYLYQGGDRGQVRLQQVNGGTIAMKWDIPLPMMMVDLDSIRRFLDGNFPEDWGAMYAYEHISKSIASIQVNAPLMTPDSGLVFNCNILGHVYRLDKESRLVWKSARITHHSIETDREGRIWTCSADPADSLGLKYDFRDDGILCLDSRGQEVFYRGLTGAFMAGGLFDEWIASTPGYIQGYGYDPYHLNDVLPVKGDGLAWEQGDLLLSLRHQSMIVLYRPGNDSILWYKKGPWMAQHDLQVVNDSVISTFNNNVYFCHIDSEGRYSNILFYDFSSGNVTSIGDSIFSSATQGRQSLTANGYYVIEETTSARYVILDSSGNLAHRFYIPYHSDTLKPMNPTWGRPYLKVNGRFVEQ